MTAFSDDGLSVIANKLGTPLMLDCNTSDMCIQSCGRSSYARAVIELRADVDLKDTIVVAMAKLVYGHVLDECPKHIISNVEKNLKNLRQAATCVQVGPKVAFKPLKQVYRHVSNRNNASSSGKNKQDVVASKEVSNSNPFDVLNSVEKDDDFGTNKGLSKSAGKGRKFDVFSFEQGSFNVASSITNTTPIVERIDKIERQIINEKLALVDDDGKPLPKVVSTENVDFNSEVKDVVDDHAGTTKRGDDYDPYNDDLYESHDMSQAICDDLDSTIRRLKNK
ncbi:hypothetical protein Tco_0499210 [Tanacetum coccineum]